jgi:hypothetical protein
MYRRIKLPTSREEKVALAISKLMSDFSLDLEAVGFYLATAAPYITYLRALEVLESAEYNKQGVEYNRLQGSYDNKLS